MRWHLPVFTPKCFAPWHEFAYLNTRGNHGLSVIKLNTDFWHITERGTVNVCCSVKGKMQLPGGSLKCKLKRVNSQSPPLRSSKKASCKSRWKKTKRYFFPGYLIKMFSQQIFALARRWHAERVPVIIQLSTFPSFIANSVATPSNTINTWRHLKRDSESKQIVQRVPHLTLGVPLGRSKPRKADNVK